MKDDTGIILIILAAVLFVVAVTWVITDQAWSRDAVKKGHAEFYIDEDYNRSWRWLPVKKDE